MRHREVSRLLGDFAVGAVDPAVRGELAAHVESCEECRDWLATYELLAATLGEDGSAAAAEHPASDLLAQYTLSPQEVDEGARAELFQHVGECAECRREMELTRAAVLAARPVDEVNPVPELAARPVARRPGWRFALAAGLALALVGSALILRSRDVAPDAPRLVAGELHSRQVIEADGAIIGETVGSGAAVVVRASQVVALGEGFAVGPGADLTIELTDGVNIQ